MDIDPTKTVEEETGKLVIACAINAADNKPYPLVIDPTTGELLVNAEFTGDVIVDIDLPDDLEYFDSITLPDALSHALPAQALKDGVILKAESGNTGNITIGGTTVSGTKGMPLEPGESVKIRVDNGSDIYYIGTLADKLHYVGG